MSSSLNKIYLIGCLGHDPEVKATPSGKTVTTLSLATSESYGSGADRKETTQWHKIVLWEKIAELAGKFLKKGSKVHIEGKVTYRDYTGRDGTKKTATEIIGQNIIFLDGKSQQQSAPTERSGEQKQSEPSADAFNYGQGGMDSDVPF